MEKTLIKILQGYRSFRRKYALGDNAIMQHLSSNGQQPEAMVLSCCDSRVDPALILQCDPGDLFVVRNIANIIPPYEKDEAHHGTSAALEFGVCFLKVKHLILLGHSQCGGIQMLLNEHRGIPNDFISNWVSIVKAPHENCDTDDYAKMALHHSLENCLTFPWIREALENNDLHIHLWFFDVKKGQVFNYSKDAGEYQPLESVADLI
ncbi:MAG: carbonic anhydrase [Gammaproteobacteria bacterium]